MESVGVKVDDRLIDPRREHQKLRRARLWLRQGLRCPLKSRRGGFGFHSLPGRATAMATLGLPTFRPCPDVLASYLF
jgi:hypothetical protein